MIRFSAVLVAVAIGVLVAGIAASGLLLVYIAIATSAVALVVLTVGVALKREELFGEAQGQSATAAAQPVQSASAGESIAQMRLDDHAAPPPFAGAAAGPGAAFAVQGQDPVQSGPVRSSAPHGNGAVPRSWGSPAPSVFTPGPKAPAGTAKSAAASPQAPMAPAWENDARENGANGGGGWSWLSQASADSAAADDAAAGSAPRDGAWAATAPAVQPVADQEPAPEPAVDEEPAPEPAVDEEPASEPAVDEEPASEPAVDEEPASEPAVDEEPAVAPAHAADEADREEPDPAVPAEPEAEPDGLVSVVRGVPRYHQAGCVLTMFMPEDDIQRLTVEAAEENGCTPCGACHSD